MIITELQQLYATHPNVEGMCKLLKDNSVRHLYCSGLCASAASLFSSVLVQRAECPFVFILGDLEEAGYFYHDLTQILGTGQVLFFPSSFRRAIKYGQKDAANEILRTEVLSRLQKGEEGLCVVTYPDALAEKVVSRKELGDKTLKLHAGEKVDMDFVTEVLRSYGFEYVDYVYEPGQYAVRGSIIDVFSFSSEFPFRIDFFGDEVESIRTFEVESQLSKEKKEEIVIVPDLSRSLEQGGNGGMVSFLDFLRPDTLLAMRDFLWLRERIQVVHDESLTAQAIAACEAEENGAISLEGKLIDGGEFTLRALDFRRMEFGTKPTGTPDATVAFSTVAQPIFHKNFDLVAESFRDYLSRNYTLYICSDSLKQTDRIRAIFEDRGDNIFFTPVERTLHEGFADDTLRLCIFTDHQLFDRFHKYNLKSDKARSGKVALSLKELNQWNPEITATVGAMSPEEIFKYYAKSIGIGGIAMAGIIGIIKSWGIIKSAVGLAAKEMGGKADAETNVKRTQRDLSMKIIAIGSIVTLILVTLFFYFDVMQGNLMHTVVAILLVAGISFLFTTVAANAIAIVGTNPVSGMTLMTLILASVVMVAVGLKGPGGMVAALVMGGVVCTALSMAGGFITDLKIGYWLGSTPVKQETWKFLGTIVSAATVGGVMIILNKTYGFTSGQLAAPQANAMAAVIEPLMNGVGAPWLLYGIGAVLAIVLNACKIPALAFALGMFIPLELNVPLVVGGAVNWYVTSRSKDAALNAERGEKGTLLASGFIAGGALMGVVSAAMRFGGVNMVNDAWLSNTWSEVLALGAYAILIFYLVKASMKTK